MKQQQIDFARTLSQSDTKTLSQRLGKTLEELGELSKAILPFENADGVRHRFTPRERILEEVVDVILCAQSIAHHLDFSDEEFDSMYNQKLKKWFTLQQREHEVFSREIPYELHLTVNCKTQDIDLFKRLCKKIGVKPIVLELQTQQPNHSIQDVMTSSVIYGTNESANLEMERIKHALWAAEFDVIREKIETVPQHPASPKDVGDIMPNGSYFECHLAVECHSEHEDYLRDISISQGAHLSKNAFKKIDDDNYVIMVTLRSYSDTYPIFANNVDKLKSMIEARGFVVGKTIVEYALYDSKISHDADWMVQNVID